MNTTCCYSIVVDVNPFAEKKTHCDSPNNNNRKYKTNVRAQKKIEILLRKTYAFPRHPSKLLD